MHFVTAKGKRICQAVEPLGIAKPAAKKPRKNKMFYFGLLLLYSLPEDWTFLLCYVILATRSVNITPCILCLYLSENVTANTR